MGAAFPYVASSFSGCSKMTYYICEKLEAVVQYGILPRSRNLELRFDYICLLQRDFLWAGALGQECFIDKNGNYARKDGVIKLRHEIYDYHSWSYVAYYSYIHLLCAV